GWAAGGRGRGIRDPAGVWGGLHRAPARKAGRGWRPAADSHPPPGRLPDGVGMTRRVETVCRTVHGLLTSLIRCSQSVYELTPTVGPKQPGALRMPPGPPDRWREADGARFLWTRWFS